MNAPPLYAPHFTFARLVADCGRVVTGAPLQLAGALMVTVALTTAASLPWLQMPARAPADTVERLWVAITTVKNAIVVVAIAVEALLVTAVSLKVLDALSWTQALRPHGLAVGFATALLIQLPQYWPSLVEPLLLSVWSSRGASLLLGLAGMIGYFTALASVGIAVPIALLDQVGPAAAIARSFRLLTRLRWRSVAIGIGYLVVGAPFAWAIEAGVARVGLSFGTPGWGRAAVLASVDLLGAASYVALASLFMQARRIANGPSAVELQEVFA